MRTKFLLIFALVTTMLFSLFCTVGAAEELPITTSVRSDIIEHEVVFGTIVYKYDLSTYFEMSNTRNFSYAIIEGNDMPENIYTIGNTLYVKPEKALIKTIKVKATDPSYDELHYATFDLKFINAPEYISNTFTRFAIVSLVLLILAIFAVFFLIPFRGIVHIKQIGKELVDESCTPKPILGLAILNNNFPLRGILLGRMGKSIKFIPFGDAYILSSGKMTQITSCEIPLSAEIEIYADKDASSGINIFFYKR